jgi:hypothetical protein
MKHPGDPDLDLAIANLQGRVPCDGWSMVNLGRAGGAQLMGERCIHAHGACWPDTEHGTWGGTVGGVPHYSAEGHWQALRLADLPIEAAVQRVGEDEYEAFLPDGQSFIGETTTLAVALAYLASEPDPLFEGDGIYSPDWQKYAELLGFLETGELQEPWTVQSVLFVGRAWRRVTEMAHHRQWYEEELEARTEKNQLVTGPEPGSPQTDDEVQHWLWKLTGAGVGDEAMAWVNDLLLLAWNEPTDRDTWVNLWAEPQDA